MLESVGGWEKSSIQMQMLSAIHEPDSLKGNEAFVSSALFVAGTKITFYVCVSNLLAFDMYVGGQTSCNITKHLYHFSKYTSFGLVV